ncbi:MAG: hypothetical protein IKO82_02725 [Prevotella sp.]|nr:hypothetical protein [Prevotella sp.]
MTISINRNTVAWFLLCVGMLLFFFADLHPWFLWPVEMLMMPTGAMLCLMSIIITRNSENSFFEREDSIRAFFLCSVMYVYSMLTSQITLGSIVVSVSAIIAFYCLLKLSPRKMERLLNLVATFYGTIMIFSVGAFIAVLLGVNIPFTDAEYQDGNYHYLNYKFFMIDIRELENEIPRFCSYFIEPSHVGTTSCFLLLAQWGKWRKWYNIPIIMSVICSLSLAAYVIFPIIILLGLWSDGKRILPKIAIMIGLLAIFLIGVMNYDGGDNVLHDRIVDRLTIENGELKGNNRVDADFHNLLMDMLDSPDIFFGRDGSKLDWGNSGATVFLYDYGIVGMALIIIMYLFVFLLGSDKRRAISAAIIISMIFMVDGHALWLCYFIPIYATAVSTSLKTDGDEHTI